ncbi:MULTISPECIES: hypothetical protein [Lentisalinibacter]|uniref:hypothetical protein n=1 Tax=Lentisalinibacter TaxID=3382081 RepID=UPI00386EB8C2
MIVRISGLVKLGVGLSIAGMLSGCVAAALVPAAPLVGGMMGHKTEVLIDEATVDPQFRELMPAVSKIAFISTDPTTVYAAEHMELNSDYLVSVVPPLEAASPSQSKRYMEEVCEGSEKPDVVFGFQTPQTDAGTGTTVRGVLTGRAVFDVTMLTDVLRCDTGWRSQFTTVGRISQGVYNADQTQINQILGQEFSGALLRLAGKMPPLEGGA